MSRLDTLFEARTIHAYTLAVLLAVAFNIAGLVGLVQLLGVTLFFGFAALLDELAGLRRSIERVDGRLESVDSQLALVTGQLDQVNNGDRDDSQPDDRDP